MNKMSEPICTVMVGLPGTGKSTLVNSERAIYAGIDMPVFVYSTDDLIEAAAKELSSTYDEVFETLIKSVTEAANASLDTAVKWRQDIIWDQTNLGVKKRAKIINRMRQAGYQVRCVCIVSPGGDSQMEDWQHRLATRPGKTIPNSVLSSMYSSFAMPTVDEGFDMITFYNMYGALLAVDLCEKD